MSKKIFDMGKNSTHSSPLFTSQSQPLSLQALRKSLEAAKAAIIAAPRLTVDSFVEEILTTPFHTMIEPPKVSQHSGSPNLSATLDMVNALSLNISLALHPLVIGSPPEPEPQPKPRTTPLIPDQVFEQPIRAWRYWELGWRAYDAVYPDPGVRLCSIGVDHTWEPKETPPARHSKNGAAFPHEDSEKCRCGYYGLKEPWHPDYPALGHIHLQTETCIGIVKMWGTIHRHEMGYRSQFAYPEVVYLPLAKAPQFVLALRETYGIEVGYYTTVERGKHYPRELEVPEAPLYIEGLDRVIDKATQKVTERLRVRTTQWPWPSAPARTISFSLAGMHHFGCAFGYDRYLCLYQEKRSNQTTR